MYATDALEKGKVGTINMLIPLVQQLETALAYFTTDFACVNAIRILLTIAREDSNSSKRHI